MIPNTSLKFMPTMRGRYITDSTGAALHSLHLFTATLVTSTIDAKRNAFNSSEYGKKQVSFNKQSTK
jgi:hypothetical protein